MKRFSIAKYLFVLLGAGMLIGAMAWHSSTRQFLAHAARTQGTVVAMTPHYSNNNSSSNNNGSITYSPVVRFNTGSQDIQFNSSSSSNPPSYNIGATVPVVYRESNPYDAKIDSFFSLWGGTLILGLLGGVFLLVGGGLIYVPLLQARADDRLRHEGMPVQAHFQSVQFMSNIEINGRSPYRVLAQWQNPKTSRVHVFASHNLWFDPTDYIKQKEIRVFLDRGNPNNYYVDLSFLPALAN
jgi:hypothetical protein